MFYTTNDWLPRKLHIFSALATGFLSGMTESWLLCGGECSFIGFNSQGEEVYWNVASDTISYVFKLISKFSNLIGLDDFRWFLQPSKMKSFEHIFLKTVKVQSVSLI